MLDFELLERRSPILLKGDWRTAYRDPAVYYHDGVFYIYFTYAITEQTADGFRHFLHLGMTTSSDLVDFTPVKLLTVPDASKNYSSPGNVIRYDGRYYICFQTYCCENGEKFGNENSRVWLSSSENLTDWSDPELIRVKGDSVRQEDMGRMIDPYLIQSDDGSWFCFYKQNGVSYSRSNDLRHWEFVGNTDCGENVCVIKDGGTYRLWCSPNNGIGEKVSKDLVHWTDTGRKLTFGQENWPWAQGRLTAGFVLDLRNEPGIGKALMFFHGTGPYDERVIFNQFACISVAWSDDLVNWEYPEGDSGHWEVPMDKVSRN